MIEIMLAALIACLTLLVEHWFPWRLMLRRDLPRLAAYVMGVLAIMAPVTGLYVYWLTPGRLPWVHAHLVALWVVVVVGGLAVLAAYGVDWLLRRLLMGPELMEIIELKERADETGTVATRES